MSASLTVGTRAEVTATFTDSDDNLADPTTVVAKTRSPAGTITTYTYGSSPELTRTSLGVYVLEFDLAASGTWKVRFAGTGAVQAAREASIEVPPSQF